MGLLKQLKQSLKKSEALRKILPVYWRVFSHPDQFLPLAKGVVHIGAHLGQESDLYSQFRLPVIWIEPIPDIFDKLVLSIEAKPDQRALRELISDQDDVETVLNISSNKGASSSIFQLADHKKLWPEVHYSSAVKVRSLRLPSALSKYGVDLSFYDALVMDTQGSELLILRGAQDILKYFKFIKTEIADFSSYEGGCVLGEMDSYLKAQGFSEIAKHRFAHRDGVGSYYNILYQNLGARF